MLTNVKMGGVEEICHFVLTLHPHLLSDFLKYACLLS